ncbi:MAG: protealysin inhibitor emfourin [Nocardioides sp.]
MSRLVSVRRTGGFAGITRTGEVDLDSDDDRAPVLSDLVAAVDAGGIGTPPASPRPDSFVYDFDLCGSTCQVHEHSLTPDLRRIAELVLD